MGRRIAWEGMGRIAWGGVVGRIALLGRKSPWTALLLTANPSSGIAPLSVRQLGDVAEKQTERLLYCCGVGLSENSKKMLPIGMN